MKNNTRNLLLVLSAMILLTSCGKNGCNKNYTEKAFGMKMEMVYVEGGEFQMGGTAEQGMDADYDELPVRKVRLSSYYIGKYEVTQSQWRAVMGEEVYSATEIDDDYPVCSINWFEAQRFCEKLSEATGKTYILPSEAQWEYAARGGIHEKKTKYAGSTNISDVAWIDYVASHPVGLKMPNELGLYDMSGNVAEWCSDMYGAYDAKDIDNPMGNPKTFTSLHIARGGGWNDYDGMFRVSSRGFYSIDERNSGLGFRVAALL